MPFGSIFTILGPKAPMCSQIVAAPGPPLNRNQTGRLDLFADAVLGVVDVEQCPSAHAAWWHGGWA